ncbi:MAG: hypothetical protein IJ783_08955 [Kiritimatiellae bacterium]|nr:hypothetical protein [Kiritimatiellia bacterium]
MKRPRLNAGRPLTKREREESMKRKREADAMNEEGTVIACARRNDIRIGLLFGKLFRNVDRANVLDEFVRYFDDGSVHRVRIPASRTFESVVREIASACKVRKGSAWMMRDALLETLGMADILVVDDLHNARHASLMGMQVAGFLREIHDVTGCAIVATYLQPYSPEAQFARRINFTSLPRAAAAE